MSDERVFIRITPENVITVALLSAVSWLAVLVATKAVAYVSGMTTPQKSGGNQTVAPMSDMGASN